jgi:hypothetical protein
VNRVQREHQLGRVEPCPLLRHVVVGHQVDQISACIND